MGLSLQWNKRSVLGGEPSFARQVQAGEAAPRVLIMVGSREQEVPDWYTLPPSMTRPQMEKVMSESRVVDNARELAGRLQQIKGGPGYVVRFHAFEDEDHLTALSTSIGRALAFALRP